jgi:hypothetical protein
MGQASIISRAALPSAELNLAGTSTTEKVFTISTSTSVACILPLPSLEALAGATGKRMSCVRIRAWGRVTGGTTTNFTPQLQFGTSTTVASNTDLESGAAVAVNSVSGVWAIDGLYYIDHVSGKIDGYASNFLSGSTVTLTAAAKADNTISASSTPAFSFTTTSAQGFVLTGTFSSGNAANVAYVDGFQLEMVG